MVAVSGACEEPAPLAIEPAHPPTVRRKVLFLCDHEAGVAPLLNDAEAAIEALGELDSFDLIFYGEPAVLATTRPSPVEAWTGSFVPATHEHRSAARARLQAKWGLTANNPELRQALLKVSPTADPLPGIAEALRRRPDIIWFLSTGDTPRPKELFTKIVAANRPNPIPFFTSAAAVDADGLSGCFLRQLAAATNGECTVAGRRLPPCEPGAGTSEWDLDELVLKISGTPLRSDNAVRAKVQVTSGGRTSTSDETLAVPGSFAVRANHVEVEFRNPGLLDLRTEIYRNGILVVEDLSRVDGVVHVRH